MFYSKGSIICAMVLNFAAEPASKNSELLEDLQERVSSGKVGQFSVDASHGLNVEPEVGEILFTIVSYIIFNLLDFHLRCSTAITLIKKTVLKTNQDSKIHTMQTCVTFLTSLNCLTNLPDYNINVFP